MEFRTLVQLPEKQTEISHHHPIMIMGSCFSENLGNRLTDNKFNCTINPYGILYNPYSIASALDEIRRNKQYTEDDLFFWNGQWHSNMHHTLFSNDDKDACLRNINAHIQAAHFSLNQAKYLFITYGTAFYYETKDTNMIAGNCHKRPEKMFHRQIIRLGDTVYAHIQKQMQCLLHTYPDLHIIFTISPIRHAKDGFHENQLSKATLLLMANHFINEHPNRASYFPAYEIMMDELRDYRFYASDMLHPSETAINYIWECFAKTYFSKSTLLLMKELEEIRKSLNHRPFHAGSERHKIFLRQLVLKIKQLQEKSPFLDFQKELETCHTTLLEK